MRCWERLSSISSPPLSHIFPSQINSSMIQRADAAGIKLQIKLIISFLIFIIILLVFTQRQKRQLIAEKQDVGQIVDSIKKIFARFSVVNLKNNTYEYLQNPEKGLAVTEKYAEFVKNFLTSM